MRILKPVSFAFVALALVTTPSANGNGKHFSTLAIDDPTIPSQRAIISWRDGTQTMIIESVVRSGDETLGWILPLPNVPSAIEPATVGTLQTMAELITPNMHGKGTRDRWLENSGFALFFAAVISFALVSRKLGNTWQVLAAVSLCVMVFIGLLLPALGKARSAMPSQGIEIASTGRIGSFDVSVIRAASGNDAKQWLEQNEFTFDARSTAILNDYASNGWCFAVAKFVKDAQGEITPHPLKFTFAASTAIYPMRLTGVTATPLLLELSVIGNERANAEHLKCWFSDAFATSVDHFNPAGEPIFVHRATDFRDVALGHPEVRALLWEHCVITRLRGTLIPDQLANDIAIGWQAPTPIRHAIYSNTAALGRAAGIGMLVLAASLLYLSIVHSLSARGNRLHTRAVFALLPIALGSAAVAYAAVDVQPISESREGWFRHRHWAIWAYDRLHHWRSQRDYWTAEELHSDLFQNWLSEWLRSDAELEQWRIDKPGGYTLVQTESGWNLTLFDRFAVSTSIEFPKKPTSND